MEKTNFKSKQTGIVINEENFKKLPANEKDAFYLTDETPNHEVKVEVNKVTGANQLAFSPIISENEISKPNVVSAVEPVEQTQQTNEEKPQE